MSTAILIEITTEMLWLAVAITAIAAIIYGAVRGVRSRIYFGDAITGEPIHPPSDPAFEVALENLQRQLTGIREPVREFGVQLEPEPEPATEGLLSPTEHRALDHLSAFTQDLRRFCAGSDLFEAVDKIHQLQSLVMAQAAARAYPNDFRLLTPPSCPEPDVEAGGGSA